MEAEDSKHRLAKEARSHGHIGMSDSGSNKKDNRKDGRPRRNIRRSTFRNWCKL